MDILLIQVLVMMEVSLKVVLMKMVMVQITIEFLAFLLSQPQQ
jgi:hypothetical protein